MQMKFSTLYQVLSAAFCTLVLLLNILSVKMVLLPFFAFSIPAGIIAYPLTFVLNNLVTELYGAKRARLMVYTALAMNVVSVLIIQGVFLLPTLNESVQHSLESVLGTTTLRIAASLIAYIVSQLAAIYIYAFLKKRTSAQFLWLRSSGSIALAQLVDTVAVDMLLLYWGLKMAFADVLPIMLFSYFYKLLFSIGFIPLLYVRIKKRRESHG